ncbi:hypothetical protein H072_2090 [Dactylellina haptotyla CBS 200.50]|uniref:DUF7729 domain-containing protein n=1 Tax=Dactylellina haptotyla (strain CBS 200.50) TaxID=1284197 RepID=S8AM70_DACHA|nr:hypothetical protein H072_2090 [Dactylellina haptotyla CBS 200.50]
MDRHSLRSSFLNRSFTLYITILLISLFSFSYAAPSQSPFQQEASLENIEVPTATIEADLVKRAPSYSPSVVRSSSSSATSTPSATPDDYVAPFPRAFDTSIALNNFTAPGCQPFFQNFLNNASFVNCLPLSFFIQSSKSWFDITKHGIVPVTQALTASCSVDAAACNNIMNDFGKQLLDASNCGADFKARNPVVVQAYASFISYPVVFAAGCQRSETGFCYADAVTNITNAADTYIYLIPLGIPIPGGARLTCSTCLQKTMRIYSAAATNTSLPISSTYGAAANLINLGCGPDFVNTTVAEAQLGSAISLSSRTWISSISFIAILSMLFL